MVDTHAHLGVCEGDAAELVEEARAAGVDRILTVGLDEGSNREALAAAEAHDAVFACVGRHPNSATGFDRTAADDIRSLAAHASVRAIGETGLDFYRDHATPEEQRRAFADQIGIALDADLPLVIHVRDPDGSTDAVDEVFETLDRRPHNGAVVLHCFSAPQRVADAAERGWFCSFAGNLTYPRADDLRVAAGQVPEELLLVETDAPFLAPQPQRGRPNRPANVIATAAVLAEVREMEPERLERVLEENSARAFAW